MYPRANIAPNCNTKLSQEELDSRKIKVFEKLYQELHKKLTRDLTERQFNMGEIKQELFQSISDQDMYNFNYNFMMTKLEKLVREKISDLPIKANVSEMTKDNSKGQMNKIKNPSTTRNKSISKTSRKLSSLRELKTKEKKEIQNMLRGKSARNIVKVSLEQLPLESKKTQEAKSKEINDEWGKIAKFNYEQYQKEIQEEKVRQREKQRLVKEVLDNQIKEKHRERKKIQAEEKKFYKEVREQIKCEKMKEKQDKERERQRTIQEKALMDKELQNRQNLKKEERQISKRNEREMIEQIDRELKLENEKLREKRKERIEFMNSLMKESEKNQSIKRNSIKQEKLDNKRAIEEYEEQLEKQNLQKNAENERKYEKINQRLNLAEDTITKQTRSNRLQEEQKYLDFIKERDKK